MKKLVASIFLLVYFVVSTGFVVSVHYCMDKINAVELGEKSDGHCSNCGMVIQDSNGCCKDEVKVVKMQVDQLMAKLLQASFSVPALLPAPHVDFQLSSINLGQEDEPVAHGPPLSDQKTYLRNCVFRI